MDRRLPSTWTMRRRVRHDAGQVGRQVDAQDAPALRVEEGVPGLFHQGASNCVGCQERWAISAGHEPRHVELFLTMAFRMVSSLRMQATKATFFALPAASSLW